MGLVALRRLRLSSSSSVGHSVRLTSGVSRSRSFLWPVAAPSLVNLGDQEGSRWSLCRLSFPAKADEILKSWRRSFSARARCHIRSPNVLISNFEVCILDSSKSFFSMAQSFPRPRLCGGFAVCPRSKRRCTADSCATTAHRHSYPPATPE